MKSIIIKSHLRDGLSCVERATGENQNLPILRNILIEADADKIQLTATNLEIAIQATVAGKTIEPGRVAVSANVLTGLISNLQSERLNLESRGANLHLSTDNYEATINGLSADDFPLIPKIKNQTEYIEIQGEVLKSALAQVVVGAHFSDVRPELSSVLFAFSLSELRLAATDSFRLAEKTIPGSQFKHTHADGFSMLLPLTTAHELMRVLKDNESVRLHYDTNQVLFRTERLLLVSRLIEGTFPDYAAIVPTSFETEIGVDRDELMNAIKLAGIVSSKTNEIRLRLAENKKSVDITSAEQGVGDNIHHLSAKTTGAGKDICFNWRYLLDGLKVLPANDVLFGINEENKPALLRSPNDATYFYIVMPILKA